MDETTTATENPSPDDESVAPLDKEMAAQRAQENAGDVAAAASTKTALKTSRGQKRSLEQVDVPAEPPDGLSSSAAAANGETGKDKEAEDDGENQEEIEEEVIYKPVYNMPYGMDLEWKSNGMSAKLEIAAVFEANEASAPARELRVCLVGRAKLKVVQGSVEVLGNAITSNTKNQPTLVTSPFWTSWMTIEANSLPCTLEFYSVRGTRSFRVVAPTRPIVIPFEWRAAAQSMAQQFCPSNESNSIAHVAALARTSIDFDDDNLQDTAIFEHPRQICMITGAKGVGKSTFLRYLANRILSSQPQQARHVAILDADVGQPELAPPGMLRLAVIQKPLLQPPYWNLVQNASREDDESNSEITIVSSVFFGADTSKSDPTRYVEGIQLLMKHYKVRVATKSPTPIPLLINMDGWVKGIGFQILTALVNSLEPTHLVQITGHSRAQTFDVSSHLNQELKESIQMVPLSSCTTMDEASICRIPAATWRNFRWATYFLPSMLSTFDAWDFVSAKELQTGWIATVGQHFRSDSIAEEDELKDECRLGLALAREPPFCVPMEAVECFVVGSDYEDTLRIRQEESPDEKERKRHRILQAMNGSIVALCINAATMESLGCGILRSIDWKKGLLYVLVPSSIPSSSLSTITTLVKGNLALPLAMLYQGVYAESFPYLTTLKSTTAIPSLTIIGSAPMKSRNNIIRKAQLMKQNNG